MSSLTTKEAFEQLTSQPMWWVGQFNAAQQAAYFKRRYKNGQVSVARMREVLENANYEVVQEELWCKK